MDVPPFPIPVFPIVLFQTEALIIHFPKFEPGLLSYHTIDLKTFNPLEVSDGVKGLPTELPVWGPSIKIEGA